MGDDIRISRQGFFLGAFVIVACFAGVIILAVNGAFARKSSPPVVAEVAPAPVATNPPAEEKPAEPEEPLNLSANDLPINITRDKIFNAFPRSGVFEPLVFKVTGEENRNSGYNGKYGIFLNVFHKNQELCGVNLITSYKDQAAIANNTDNATEKLARFGLAFQQLCIAVDDRFHSEEIFKWVVASNMKEESHCKLHRFGYTITVLNADIAGPQVVTVSISRDKDFPDGR